MSWLSELLNRWRRRPPAPAPVPPPPVPGPTLGDLAAQLLARHNAARQTAGLPLFRLDSRLCSAATLHAVTMAARLTCAHWGLGDGDPWSRIAASGYGYRVASENVAEGQRSAAEVVADWMDSPGHRAAILGAYADVGFGAAKGSDGQWYWCADFGSPLAKGFAAEVRQPLLYGRVRRRNS